MAIKQLSDGGPDGTRLGQNASDKVGFHGATPVVQAATTTPPANTTATNSSPYGYTQAQANAITAWIIAVDAALKAKGIVANS